MPLSVPLEAPRTLSEPPPRTLGLADQLGQWGNLGVSLVGLGGAVAVQAPLGAPPLSLVAALAAVVVGTLIGSLVLGASLALGQRAGAPAMVLLRGLLGARAAVVPTVLNIAQCLGWGAFELVVIAGGLRALTGGALPTWAGMLLAGALSTALAVRPLGAVRLLRRYVSVLVLAALALLAVGLLTSPEPAPTGSWTGFWAGADAAVAVAVSWVPLGADYSRHARTARGALTAGAAGFALGQIACYGLGLLALARVASSPDGVFDVLRAAPLGLLALAVLVLREGDQSFTNVYSTAVSLQNLRPSADRVPLAVGVGAVVTALALAVDLDRFAGFLYLVGAVFVPLSGALLGAWLRARRTPWQIADDAVTRPGAIAAWIAGIVAYQLVNPGSVPGWSAVFARAGAALHTTGHVWLSASLTSLAVAGLLGWAAPPRRG